MPNSSLHSSLASAGMGHRRRTVLVLVVFAIGAAMFFSPGRANAESGEILAPGQNGFTVSRWHDWFCVDFEVCETGDVNGDGADDIVAVVRSTGTAWVALAQPGASRFAPSSIWSRSACTGTRDCELADVNADGRDDLVVFDRVAATMSYALSNGTSFGVAQTHSEPGCTGPAICKMGDVDADRDADVVVFSRSPRGVSVSRTQWTCPAGPLRYDAFGRWLPPPPCYLSFAAPALWHDAFCQATEVCDLGDFNGDGRVDLVAFGQGERGFVWASMASSVAPRFDVTMRRLVDFCTAGSRCDVGDFNGDGRDDLVSFAQRYTGSDDFRPRTPGGDVFVSLARPRVVGGLPVAGDVDFGPVTIRHGQFCVTGEVCATGDFDGDGQDDLAAFVRNTAASRRGDVYIGLSNFGGETTWRLSADSLHVIRAEDDWGDEPYAYFVTFRSTIGVAGSTEVTMHRFTAGQLPRTLADFDGVRLPTAGELLSGTPLEVMGTIVVALDQDGTPRDLVDVLLGRVRTALRTELVRIVEGGNIVTFLTNPTQLSNDLQSARRNIIAAARPSDFEAVSGWGLSYFDPDDLVGVHAFTFIAVDSEIAPSLRLVNDRDSTSGVPAATVGTHGPMTRALQCLASDCRISPAVRYDVTVTLRALP